MKTGLKLNLALVIPAVLIAFLSVSILYSLGPALAKRQMAFFLLGAIAFFFMSGIHIDILLSLWKYIFFSALALLVVTVVFSEAIRGSSRWLDIGFLRFQPSELAKLALIISLSGMWGKDKRGELGLVGVLRALGVAVPLILLTAIQPDLGTSIVLICIFAFLILYRGVHGKVILSTFILFGFIFGPVWQLLKPYQQDRVLVFLNPYGDPLGSGYNVLQSMIAVGSGSVFGKGFGLGTQSKLRFLPEYHTDFIFASFSEEWGLVGAVLVLTLFLVLLLGVAGVARRAEGPRFFVCAGVFCMILFQLFINVGMNLGIMPVTGIPLPLLSYGGSSILTTLASLGVVHSIWKSEVS